MTKENKVNISLTDSEITNLVKVLNDKAIHWLKIKQFEKAHKVCTLAEKIELQQMGINN